MDIIHHGMEVLGMDAVWVLCGQMMGNGVESVLVPLLPLDCDSFKEEYTA